MKLSEKLSALLEGWKTIPLNGTLPHGKTKDALMPLIGDAQVLEALASNPDLANENENLKALAKENQAQIDILRTELDALRAEQAKRKEDERELPPAQLALLNAIPTEGGGDLTLAEIASSIGMELSEANIHAERLCEFTYVVCRNRGALDVEAWNRRTAGDKYLLAKRLAGELAQDGSLRREAIEEKILLLLALPGRDLMPMKTWNVGYVLSIGEEMAGVYLERLRKAGFTTARADPHDGVLVWNRTEFAADYLATYGLLQKQYEEREYRRLQREAEKEPPAAP